MDELHARLEGGKQLVEAADMSSPVKVAYAVKQLAKEASVGGQLAAEAVTVQGCDVLLPLKAYPNSSSCANSSVATEDK